jgi:hypothetical protein
MALPDGVVGGGRRGILISCTDPDGTVIDLTGSSAVAGTITSQADTTSTRAIAGTLDVIGAATLGKVQWTFSAADLVAGQWLVQITVSYASGLGERSFAAPWTVRPGYTVTP